MAAGHSGASLPPASAAGRDRSRHYNRCAGSCPSVRAGGLCGAGHSGASLLAGPRPHAMRQREDKGNDMHSETDATQQLTSPVTPDKPLAGKHIAITRPPEQSADLAVQLAALAHASRRCPPSPSSPLTTPPDWMPPSPPSPATTGSSSPAPTECAPSSSGYPRWDSTGRRGTGAHRGDWPRDCGDPATARCHGRSRAARVCRRGAGGGAGQRRWATHPAATRRHRRVRRSPANWSCAAPRRMRSRPIAPSCNRSIPRCSRACWTQTAWTPSPSPARPLCAA